MHIKAQQIKSNTSKIVKFTYDDPSKKLSKLSNVAISMAPLQFFVFMDVNDKALDELSKEARNPDQIEDSCILGDIIKGSANGFWECETAYLLELSFYLPGQECKNTARTEGIFISNDILAQICHSSNVSKFGWPRDSTLTTKEKIRWTEL